MTISENIMKIHEDLSSITFVSGCKCMCHSHHITIETNEETQELEVSFTTDVIDGHNSDSFWKRLKIAIGFLFGDKSIELSETFMLDEAGLTWYIEALSEGLQKLSSKSK